MDIEHKEKIVEMVGPSVTQEDLDALGNAIHSKSSSAMLKLLPTKYRMGEFKWVEDLNIDFRNLLHTEQEFEYIAPLEIGKTPVMCTRLFEMRKKIGLMFVTLQTEVRIDGDLKVVSRTTFLSRIVKKGSQ